MLRFADVFKSGMTLQRDAEIPVFGECDRALHLNVSLNGEPLYECDIETGEFRFLLPSLPASYGNTLRFSGGGEDIELCDVDIGEVWIAGGQSNMEFLLKYDCDYRRDRRENRAFNEDEHLRFYDVPKFASAEHTGYGIPHSWGVWRSCCESDVPYFSAVGYYFARVLRESYPDVPVAIIGCNWGGTRARTWTDYVSLKNDPELGFIVSDYEKGLEGLDIDKVLAADKATRLATAKGNKEGGFSDKLMTGEISSFMTKLLRIAARLFLSKKNNVPVTPFSEHRPAGLYESMLKKIAGFGARGVIWYQGESDEDLPDKYDRSFGLMIASWRRLWNKELPFLFVQLAPFGDWFGITGAQYPLLREKQELVSKTVPNTYMASIMDCGSDIDIHPKNKKPVGERLAYLALGHIYGEDIVCDPPEALNASKSGNLITISFANAEEGLLLNGETVNGLELYVGNEALSGFTARVEADKLIVELSENMPAGELKLAYCRSAYCEANIHTPLGLTIKPFELFVSE